MLHVTFVACVSTPIDIPIVIQVVAVLSRELHQWAPYHPPVRCNHPTPVAELQIWSWLLRLPYTLTVGQLLRQVEPIIITYSLLEDFAITVLNLQTSNSTATTTDYYLKELKVNLSLLLTHFLRILLLLYWIFRLPIALLLLLIIIWRNWRCGSSIY